jgi:predicted nucleic acid-binding Zn ribbon protein
MPRSKNISFDGTKKTCSVCNIEKNIEQFRMIHTRNIQYRASKCIDCKRKEDNKYNREKHGYKPHHDRIIQPKKECHCIVCGILINKGKYCSRECIKRNYIDTYGNTRIKKCVVCGVEFKAYRSGSYIYCSDKCKLFKKKEASKIARRKDGKLNGYTNHRKRAKQYGGIYEPIKRINVFERDKWTCKMCGIKTPIELSGDIYDNSPELDHIIPLSKGGSHTYNNTQCLCRKCNNKKSNHIIIQQEAAIA